MKNKKINRHFTCKIVLKCDKKFGSYAPDLFTEGLPCGFEDICVCIVHIVRRGNNPVPPSLIFFPLHPVV